MRSKRSANPAASSPEREALKAYTDTTRPNLLVGRWRSRSRIAPSGEMIMKSRMIVNCRKASIPTTNFWYEEKAGGGPACAPWWGGGAAAGAGRTDGEAEEERGMETGSLLMKSLSCPDAWMNGSVKRSQNGSVKRSWRRVGRARGRPAASAP